MKLIHPCTLFVFALLCTLSGPAFAAEALTPEQSQTIEAAQIAWKRTPEGRRATEEFNAVRKAYRRDRAKFPADRDENVAFKYRKALRRYEQLQRNAMLAQDPALAPLLAAADVASNSPHPAMIPIKDEPGLPRVLLIGDSISIGYTLPVRNLLKGKANVHRIPVNGGATDVGIERMQSWLGDGNWDVIHFNFGLHDAKHQSETTLRTSHEQYAHNLRVLVDQMQATGAKVIFATTTPVPKGGDLAPGRKFDSIPRRNKVALRVMAEKGVAIDDLYSAVLPVFAEVGRPNDVHFQLRGYELLAKQVAASIETELPQR